MWYSKSMILVLLLFNAVHVHSQLDAEFSVDVSEGCAPLVVEFTNLTPHDSENEYFWNFGNGKLSDLKDPTTVYSEPGVYSVELRVINQGVSQTVLKSDLITIFEPVDIDFSIDGSPDGCAPHNISFQVIGDEAMQNPSYTWDFGDGTLAAIQAPDHNYTEAGEFDVTLIIDYNNGCLSKITKENFIKVNKPRAFFKGDKTKSCEGELITAFENQSYGSENQMYLWKFGDGGNSSETNPVHAYEVAGIYDVSLKVTDDLGCSDSITMTNYITVEETVSQFAIAKDIFCPGESIEFENTSVNNKYNSWDFGDGTNSSLASPAHSYATPGEYTVSLRIENGVCISEFEKNIIIEEVVADFDISENYKCSLPATIGYIDKSTNANTYEWTFDNGTTSDLQNPSVTYSGFKPGTNSSYETYTTKLTVTSSNGCKSSKVINDILTISLPIARISADNLLGCVPLTVNLQSSSTYVSDQDEIASYQWLLNGDEVSDQSSWNTTFNEPTEEEKIELVITTGLGCVSKINDVIKAGEMQQPDFSVKDKSVFCASETVEFVDLSSDQEDIDFIEWDYGDGSKSFVGELTHMYTDTGTFDVGLTVFHNGCETSVVKSKVLTINGPIVDFNRINQCENVMTAELYSDLIDATEFEWDFGDNSAKVTGSETVTHTYAQEGNYEIILKASNSNNGCNAEIKKNITIIESFAGLVSSKDSSCINESLDFDPQSSTNPGEFSYGGDTYKFMIDFGDGTPIEYINETISHSYSAEGKYTSELIIRDLNNCADTARVLVEVFDVKPDFEHQYDNGCLPAQYTFFDRTVSDVPIVEWEWNFGDGSLSSDQNPVHLIESFGIYDVKLTSTSKIGCKRSITKSNELVLLEPKPVIVADRSNTCINTIVSFEESSFANITEYDWDFGDGAVSNESSPEHSYANIGSYDISLTIKDNHGCIGSASYTDFISVQDFPVANFNSDQTVSNCYPFKVDFNDLSSGESLTKWAWNFGDNGTSTIQNPQHIYTKPGLYDVQVIVSTSNGCNDTLTRNELIEVKGPYAEIMAMDTVCLNTDVEFSLVNMQNVENVFWDFGDGNVIEDFTPVHQYQLNGLKYPTALLINSGSFACNKYINDTLYVDEVTAMMEFGDGNGFGCEPYNLNFINNSVLADRYLWKVGDEIIAETKDATHTFTDAGLYETSLKVTSISGCHDSVYTEVLVHPLPTVEIARDTFICRGDEIMLWASGGQLYNWSPENSLDYSDIDIPLATPEITTIYKVNVTDENECINTDSVRVTVQQPPYVVMQDSTIIIGESIFYNLEDNGIKSYQWFPDLEISDASVANPLILPTESRTYNVALTDTADCFTETFSFNINVEKKYSVDVPTAFTPNGDNLNDLIMVKGWGIKELKHFRIFDRYGALVYETNDIEMGWDGKYKGVEQESGIYNYIVSVLSYDGNVREIKGAFELIK